MHSFTCVCTMSNCGGQGGDSQGEFLWHATREDRPGGRVGEAPVTIPPLFSDRWFTSMSEPNSATVKTPTTFKNIQSGKFLQIC